MISACLQCRNSIGWSRTQCPKRSGWWRITCGTCGRFIGYRPKDLATGKRKKATQDSIFEEAEGVGQ